MRQRDILTVTSTIGTLALAISQDQDETNLTNLTILDVWDQIIAHLYTRFIWSQLSEMALWDQSQGDILDVWDQIITYLNIQFIWSQI